MLCHLVTLDPERHMLDYWVTQCNSNMVFWYVLVVKDRKCFVNIGMLNFNPQILQVEYNRIKNQEEATSWCSTSVSGD